MNPALSRLARRLPVPKGVRNLAVAFRYPNERRLLKSGPQPRTDAPSFLFFTVHKCASTYTPKALEYLNDRYLRLQSVDMAGYFYRAGSQDTHSAIQGAAGQIFSERGYLYAPFRKPIDIDGVGAYRRVVMLRDPRDVLTSLFYSVAHSHALPTDPTRREEYRSRRDQARTMTVDEFVRSRMSSVRDVYRGYAEFVRETDTPILYYETMILAFDEWAEGLGRAMDVELGQGDMEHLRALGGFNRETAEDKDRHVRQRTPGDHRRKLSDSTIALLNRELHDVLRAFNYD